MAKLVSFVEDVENPIIRVGLRQQVEDGRTLARRCAEHRCIGCGRFLPKDRRWNQCADCDTRLPEEVPPGEGA